MRSATDFSRLLSSFFTDRLMRQLQASPHTIASYRDTFRLLVRYALRELHKQPASLELDDLDSEFLGRFLSHLETERGNDTRTRNARLAAIRSFFGYLALQEPQHAALAGRVVSMPAKRYTRRPVDFLERDEVEALLHAPDTCTRAGRRNRTLLLVAVQTGLRASELIGLRCENVQLSAAGAGAHVRCQGKGRKQRCTPLRKDAAQALRAWLEERNGSPEEPVFPNSRGSELSHDGLGLYSRQTCRRCAPGMSLAGKQTGDSPRAPSHHSHGIAAERRRSCRYRSVARSRIRRKRSRSTCTPISS